MITSDTYQAMLELLQQPTPYHQLGRLACYLGKNLDQNPFLRFYATHPSRMQWENGWKEAWAESRFMQPLLLED